MLTKTTIPALRFIILICCILFFSPVKAQQKNNLVYRHSGFGLLNKKYFLNDVKISKRNVGQLLEKENNEAYKVFKSARAQSITGTLLTLPAGVLFIVGVGSYAFAGWRDVTENPALLIAGIVGMSGALVLIINANGKFKRAADIYNHSNSSTGKMQLNFGLTRSGVGLTLSL
jgi:hypothetical protein